MLHFTVVGLDLYGLAVVPGTTWQVPEHLFPLPRRGMGAVRSQRGSGMSVAKIVELNAASPKGFDDAMKICIERASQTLSGVKGAWIQDQSVIVVDGKITEFRVNLKVTFLLEN